MLYEFSSQTLKTNILASELSRKLHIRNANPTHRVTVPSTSMLSSLRFNLWLLRFWFFFFFLIIWNDNVPRGGSL